MVFSEVPFMSELNPEYLKVVKCLEISRANYMWCSKKETTKCVAITLSNLNQIIMWVLLEMW